MTMDTASERNEECPIPPFAGGVRRVALFDGEGRVVWSTGIEAPGEAVSPCSTKRWGTSYQQLREAWLAGAGALEGSGGDERWRSLDWSAESDLDFRSMSGQRFRLMQRRTPDGGAILLLLDQTGHETPAQNTAHGDPMLDAMHLALTKGLSWLSQELRTPLQAILGFAQLMQRDSKDPLSARHRPRVDEIVQGGEQLARILTDVLDSCRAELSRVPITLAPTDARAVVEAARASLAPLAARAQVKLTTLASGSADIPLTLADPRWLLHVVTTLGERAIEHHRPHGVVRIEVSVPREGTVRINVSDDGIGIHPDRQATLLLPLRSTADSERVEATRLKLAMSNRLAELMHGQLRFRSIWTKGSDFWIDVPACGVNQSCTA